MRIEFEIESVISSLRIVENTIDEITGKIGISQDNYGKILVSTLEAVNNAIVHGNRSDPAKIVKIGINYTRNNLKIIISDQGNGFKPDNLPDPTRPDNIESINGRGVFLMSRLADEIAYNKKGNTVTLSFKNIKS
jgi:serine/threonine-protein kinase RsbW